MSEPRAAFAEAGAAMREAIARACDEDLSALDWRVLGAVLALIGTYSRTSDALTVGQVAAAARVHERNARRSLGILAGVGVIDRVPTRGRVPARITLPQPGSPSARVEPTRVTVDPPTRVTVDPPTEKSSEKSPPTPRRAGGRRRDRRNPRARGEAPRRIAELERRRLEGERAQERDERWAREEERAAPAGVGAEAVATVLEQMRRRAAERDAEQARREAQARREEQERRRART